MARYRYKALGAAGEIIAGELDGASRDAVTGQLQALGHMPFLVVESARRSLVDWLDHDLFERRRLSYGQLGIVTEELATMLQSGLPLERALSLLVAFAGSKRLRSFLARLLDRVRSGASFADALAADAVDLPPSMPASFAQARLEECWR